MNETIDGIHVFDKLSDTLLTDVLIQGGCLLFCNACLHYVLIQSTATQYRAHSPHRYDKRAEADATVNAICDAIRQATNSFAQLCRLVLSFL